VGWLTWRCSAEKAIGEEGQGGIEGWLHRHQFVTYSLLAESWRFVGLHYVTSLTVGGSHGVLYFILFWFVFVFVFVFVGAWRVFFGLLRTVV
jgi:hypothetical protein